VLDGEVAVFDEQLVSQFYLLHDAKPAIVCTPPLLMAFDCLWIGNRDLRPAPLHERRPALEAAVDGAELILPVRRLATDGLEAWELGKECGYEGLVAKDGGSPYQAGESRSWVTDLLLRSKELVRETSPFADKTARLGRNAW